MATWYRAKYKQLQKIRKEKICRIKAFQANFGEIQAKYL